MDVHRTKGISGSSGRALRIVFLHVNNVDVGGADYRLFQMVEALAHEGADVHVLLARKTSITGLYESAGLPYSIVEMPRLQKSRGVRGLVAAVLRFPATTFRVVRAIRPLRADVVHSNDVLDLYGPFAAMLLGARSVHHVRYIIPGARLFKALLSRILLATCDEVLCVSEYLRQELFSRGQLAATHKVRVVHDWCDLESPRCGSGEVPRSETRDGIVIGMFGRLEPWKGQHVLVEAIPAVLREIPDAEFWFVGGTVEGRGKQEYKQTLLAAAERAGVQDRVHFLGERSDVRDLYDQCDVVVHASVQPEPLGLVVMEAMSRGRVVVATRLGGPLEQIVDGDSGFLYEAGNSEALARAIVRVIRDPELAAKIGASAIERVRSHFSKPALLPLLFSAYRPDAAHP